MGDKREDEKLRKSLFVSPKERKAVSRKNVDEALMFLDQGGTKEVLPKVKKVMNVQDVVVGSMNMEEQATNTDEIYMDSQAVRFSTIAIKACAKNLTEEMSPYNYAEFAELLKSFVKKRAGPFQYTQSIPWNNLQNELPRLFSRSPNYSTLAGFLSSTVPVVEKKERAVRQQRERKENLVVKRPEELKAADKTEQSVEESVTRIRSVVSDYYKAEKKPVDYLKLIYNPNSFGKTVENVLHLSFLARDGRVKLEKDEKGLLVVRTKKGKKEEDDVGPESNQNMFTISWKDWKGLKDIYGSGPPLIS